jgi:hypothetical protein
MMDGQQEMILIGEVESVNISSLYDGRTAGNK